MLVRSRLVATARASEILDRLEHFRASSMFGATQQPESKHNDYQKTKQGLASVRNGNCD